MLRFSLSCLLFASALASGSIGCPCLTSLAEYGYRDGEPLDVTVAEQSYTYPSGYGLAQCAAHDETLPPYCSEAGAPSWCQDSWCYVDPSNCNLVTSQSTYLTADLYYSYRTCGNANTYDSWFGGSGGSGREHALVDLVNVTGAYLRSTVNALEGQELELREADISSGCTYEPSCDCCGCSPNDAWSGVDGSENSITLSRTTTTPYVHPVTPSDRPHNIDVCLSEVVSAQFQHVAAKEADTSRVGYEYYGSQLGTYMQWPGVQWCPAAYDPRFRNWYAGGVSGPKDMVVVIDTSGSMRGARREMAEEAATRVIDTLTESDYAVVVTFSSSAKASSGTLVRMTADARATAKRWIDSNVDASGGTNYNAALDKVWSVLAASTSATSQCNRLVLFLSDGQPQNWDESDYGRASRAATMHNAHLLTYALGEGADSSKLKRLACENQGIFYPVGDSDNLGDAMASYYDMVSAMLEPCQLRFTEYEDWFTKKTLLAACLPAYKRADQSQPLTCGAHAEAGSGEASSGSRFDADWVPHLIGVACMDMSLIASDAQLRGHAGWTEFWAVITQQMRACPRRVLSEAALEQLRAQVSAQSTCHAASSGLSSAMATSATYATRTSAPKACDLPLSNLPLSVGALVGIAVGSGVALLVLVPCVLCKLRKGHCRWRPAPSALPGSNEPRVPVAVAVAVPIPMGQPV